MSFVPAPMSFVPAPIPPKITQIEQLSTRQLIWLRDSYYDGMLDWRTNGIVNGVTIENIEEVERHLSTRTQPEPAHTNLKDVTYELERYKHGRQGKRPLAQVNELWFARWINPDHEDHLAVPDSWERTITLGGVRTPPEIVDSRYVRKKFGGRFSHDFVYAVFIPFTKPDRSFATALSIMVLNREGETVFRMFFKQGNVRMVHGVNPRLFNLDSQDEYLMREALTNLPQDKSDRNPRYISFEKLHSTAPTPMGF